MTGPVINVVNLADVQRFILQAPRMLVAKGFTKALAAASEVFESAVIGLCPVKAEATGGLIPQGELRATVTYSIKISNDFIGGRGTVGWGRNIPKNLPLWVEVGHRLVVRGGSYLDNRGRLRKGTHKATIPAHPFLNPAFEASVDAAIEAFADSLAGSIGELY